MAVTPDRFLDAIELRQKQLERPIVLGKQKKILTPAQYDIVKALLAAQPFGLSKDELDDESGRGEARKTLRTLSDSDNDWRLVIHFPAKKGDGYRIG